ncbi:hypothetical protein GCM10027589_37090 [Actinocorallia lasiicapitis]
MRRIMAWVLAAVVVIVTWDVLVAGPLTRWDRRSMLPPGGYEVGPGPWHDFWRVVVMGGQFWLIGSLAGLAACWAAWRLRRWWPLVVTGVWIVALNVTVQTFKMLLGRPAPHAGFDALHVPGKLSYPSGHAAMAAACMVMVVGLLALPSRPGRALWWAYGLSALAALATVLLGYHWPTDTITGYALGLLFGWAGLWGLDRASRRFG